MELEARERFDKLEGLLASLVQVASSQEKRLGKITGVVSSLAEVASSHEAELRELREGHTDERLGSLIRMMDDWIRNNRRNGGTAPS